MITKVEPWCEFFCFFSFTSSYLLYMSLINSNLMRKNYPSVVCFPGGSDFVLPLLHNLITQIKIVASNSSQLVASDMLWSLGCHVLGFAPVELLCFSCFTCLELSKSDLLTTPFLECEFVDFSLLLSPDSNCCCFIFEYFLAHNPFITSWVVISL